MAPVVPCPVLVGRAAEFAALTAALDAARAGDGRMVFVVGEAGLGKSRLVHEIASIAQDRNMLVLRGRAVPGAAAVAFRPLAEALATVVPGGGFGADFEPWLSVLAAIVPTVGRAGEPVDATAPVRGEAVLRLLRSQVGSGGGLLVLEDLHWADPETLAIVEHLSDHLERAPVLCVTTVRSEEDSDARDLVRRVAARRTAHVIELAGLNAAQVAAMIYGCTGGADAADIERVVELADGVPFLVEEILASPGLPASFAAGVEARLRALAVPDRRLLVTAAAFGPHFDWRLLSAASGMTTSEVVDGLDRGVSAQLIEVDGKGFRFRHALTADAVFDSVIPPRREEVATAALAALEAACGERLGERPDVAARLAERAGQPARAGRLFRASGENALSRGALQTAVVALDRAARLLPDGDDRDQTLERLVEALALAGRVEDALRVGRDVTPRLPPWRGAAVHLRLAGAAVTASRWKDAGEQLAAAQPLVGASPSLAAELALREGELAVGVGDVARAEARARAALELARRQAIPDVECGALQLLGRCARRASLERAEDWFREALVAADAHGSPVWRLRALHEMGTIGLLEGSAVGPLVEAQALALELGAMATAAVLDVELAAGYNGLHDVEGQRRHGRAAVERGTPLGLDLLVAYGWHHIAVAAALRGDDRERETAAAASRVAAPGNRDIDGLLVGGADLLAGLLDEDHNRVLAAAQRCAELLRGSNTAPPVVFRALWPMLLAISHRPEASGALAEMEEGGLAVSRAARGYLTMARAVLAGVSDAHRAASLAVAADDDLANFPLWRCIARRLVADAAAADGWTIPDPWLGEAEEWFRSQGYVAVADACRARRGRSSTMSAAWADLGVTRREADVLGLVIEGCSNREIAAQLYLSVRTVEKHVESLLRKTATSNRTQLARVATVT